MNKQQKDYYKNEYLGKKVELSSSILGEKKAQKLYGKSFKDVFISGKIVSTPKTVKSRFEVKFLNIKGKFKIGFDTVISGIQKHLNSESLPEGSLENTNPKNFLSQVSTETQENLLGFQESEFFYPNAQEMEFAYDLLSIRNKEIRGNQELSEDFMNEIITSSDEDEECKDYDISIENNPDRLEICHEEEYEETLNEIEEDALTQIINSIATSINSPIDSSTRKGKPSSLTLLTRNNIKTPLDLVFFILNTEFWESMADQTNRYAAQCKQKAKEDKKSLEILSQGIKYQWNKATSGAMDFSNFGNYMSKNRFEDIMKMLHFSDNKDLQSRTDRI
ncbi:hypothetical protein BB558_007349 [Smittium angustum]|uniref:PiggyBac transposable element-derived protein domain-containing protein n=1 Tax=Smittium angustum TaxID=133377 RepID=A0A2U1IVA1_SMIAN|nr:hypothetical protein BB558_007349 [Smittium angustum]